MSNFAAGMGGPMDGRGMTQAQQQAAMQQMRNNYMNSQAGHFSGNSGSGNSNNAQNGQIPNAMSSAAAMQRYQQMQSSRQQMMNQMRGPQNMMGGSNMKQTDMRFPSNVNPAAVAAAAARANFSQNTAQAAQLGNYILSFEIIQILNFN